MPTNDENNLNNIDDETQGTLVGDTPDSNSDNIDSSTDIPTSDQSSDAENTEEARGLEKISILVPDFAKYLKLVRDGYTLSDLIKIYGIDNDIKFGLPPKPETVYSEEDEVSTSSFDSEGMDKDFRNKFFEECGCKAESSDDDSSDSSSSSSEHTVVNCEEELVGGTTFAEFMINKSGKFFPKEEADSPEFVLNNDEWELNKEEELEGAKDFIESIDNIDKGIELPVDDEPAEELEDKDDFLAFMVTEMKKIFDNPESEELTAEFFDDVIAALLTQFFIKVAESEELEDITFANMIREALVKQLKISEGEEVTEEEYEDLTTETIRGMILNYAYKDGLNDTNKAFNKFLNVGFGKFLTETFGAGDEDAIDMIDFIARNQYKDAASRKFAYDSVNSEEEKNIDRIALSTEEGKEYDFDPDKDWTKRTTNPELIVENFFDNEQLTLEGVKVSVIGASEEDELSDNGENSGEGSGEPVTPSDPDEPTPSDPADSETEEEKMITISNDAVITVKSGKIINIDLSNHTWPMNEYEGMEDTELADPTIVYNDDGTVTVTYESVPGFVETYSPDSKDASEEYVKP